MTKEEILNRLLQSYNRCKEHEKTDKPHKMAFCYGMLGEAIRSILQAEKMFNEKNTSS